MTSLVRLRLALMGVGVLVGLYGGYLLLGQGLDNLVATLKWLVGGLVLHDGILAPLVIAVCFLGVRLLPAAVRRPATVGLVVLGTVTIAAIPVLGRFGERPDNPTLLDRDYAAGWLVLAGLVLVGVVLGSVQVARRDRPRRRRTH